jgi:uncharacterized membrane protein
MYNRSFALYIRQYMLKIQLPDPYAQSARRFGETSPCFFETRGFNLFEFVKLSLVNFLLKIFTRCLILIFFFILSVAVKDRDLH